MFLSPLSLKFLMSYGQSMKTNNRCSRRVRVPYNAEEQQAGQIGTYYR